MGLETRPLKDPHCHIHIQVNKKKKKKYRLHFLLFSFLTECFSNDAREKVEEGLSSAPHSAVIVPPLIAIHPEPAEKSKKSFIFCSFSPHLLSSCAKNLAFDYCSGLQERDRSCGTYYIVALPTFAVYEHQTMNYWISYSAVNVPHSTGTSQSKQKEHHFLLLFQQPFVIMCEKSCV